MTPKISFKVEKLVRDKMPEILMGKGITVFAHKIDKEQYVSLLKDKLLEEAAELFESTTIEEIKEEIADLLEVIHAFSKLHDISLEEIEQMRVLRKEEKGGFEEGTYNEVVEMPLDHESVTYYKARPHKYPEINKK